jgi:hypothetical protein
MLLKTSSSIFPPEAAPAGVCLAVKTIAKLTKWLEPALPMSCSTDLVQHANARDRHSHRDSLQTAFGAIALILCFRGIGSLVLIGGALRPPPPTNTSKLLYYLVSRFSAKVLFFIIIILQALRIRNAQSFAQWFPNNYLFLAKARQMGR